MKLYIRVKFRALFVTFGTVEREMGIGSIVQSIINATLRIVGLTLTSSITNQVTEEVLKRSAGPIVLHDSRGVYVEVR